MSSEHLPHDPAYKQFFSDPIMVESLLRDFVGKDYIRASFSEGKAFRHKAAR